MIKKEIINRLVNAELGKLKLELDKEKHFLSNVEIEQEQLKEKLSKIDSRIENHTMNIEAIEKEIAELKK